MNKRFEFGIIYDLQMNKHCCSSDKIHIESPERLLKII